MKNKQIKALVEVTAYGLDSAMSDQDAVDEIYANAPPADVEALYKKDILAAWKAHIKNSEPEFLTKQDSFPFDSDKEKPYKMANGDTIKFGNSTGEDMIAEGERKLNNLNAAHKKYLIFQTNSSPIYTESIKKGISTWEAIENLGLNKPNEKDKKAY